VTCPKAVVVLLLGRCCWTTAGACSWLEHLAAFEGKSLINEVMLEQVSYHIAVSEAGKIGLN